MKLNRMIQRALIVLVLLVSVTAAAGVPVESLVDSFAGRFFLTETQEGARIAEHAIGHRIASAEDYDAFLRNARDGNIGMWDSWSMRRKIGKISDRMGSDGESGTDAESFDSAKVAARGSGLTLIHPDAELGDIEFFPGVEAAAGASLRQQFLEGVGPSAERIQASIGKSIERIDSRASQWLRDRQCVSCHSIHPFTAARARTNDWQSSPLAQVKTFMESRIASGDVANRPWYHGQATGSTSSELILSLSTLTQINEESSQIRNAVERLVALQGSDGSFPWLDFRLQPWESSEGKIYGNAQALEAFTRLPEEMQAQYSSTIQNLRGYLRTQAHASDTSLWNKLGILSADTRSPGILTQAERKEIIQSLLNLQLEDGGWSLNHLANWQKRGTTPIAVSNASDGYASAYSLYILRQGGLLNDAEWDMVRPAWQKGIDWLVTHQTAEGAWESASVNRDSPFNRGLMEDAATAYASLALQAARAH